MITVLRQVSLGWVLALTASPLLSQSPSKWCVYAPRSPRAIITQHEHSDPIETANVAVSGDQFPSRVGARFTGNVRVMSDSTRNFLKAYERFLQRSGEDTLFQREVELTIDSTTYWLLIQEATLQDFRAEVAPRDTFTLFLLWAGAYGIPRMPKHWVFLLNEFSSATSTEFWARELATCGHS